MKKTVIVIGVIAVLAAVIYTQRVNIAARVMSKGLDLRMNADLVADLEDGLHLALCGAGGPLPAPNASGPCVAVVAGKRLFIVDAGTDGLRNLTRMGYNPGSIEAVFITHFHSDHIDGLGELATIRWVAQANTAPLPVYGPTGIERIVTGLNKVYEQDVDYRHAHHGDIVAPRIGAGMTAMSFDEPELGTLATLIDEDDLKIEALAVGHFPVKPAVGYRFTYKGRSLLITGDTVRMPNIEKFANGVDLLVHEALAPNLVGMMHDTAVKLGNKTMAKVTHDILDYHASPVEAAETAKAANVGHLLYYHIVPPIVFPGQEALFLNGADKIFEDYTVGQDGTAFSLPAGSDEIILTRSGL